MQKRKIAMALVVVCVTGACSTYTPVATSITPRSGTVRLSLNDAGRSEMLGPLGSQVTSVEGEVSSISDSALTIAVQEVGRESADNERLHGQLVTIPSRFIGRIDRKHVQVARSLLIAGAIIGGAIWIGSQGHGDVSFGNPPGPPIGGQ